MKTPKMMRKGETKKAEAILDRPAGSEGCVVVLRSNRWLMVPPRVAVKAANTSAEFEITAIGPSAGDGASGQIVGSAGGSQVIASMICKPPALV